MPFEIHRQEYLYLPIPKFRSRGRQASVNTDWRPQNPPIHFNFQHDLESLWWVLLCTLTKGIDHHESREFANRIFCNDADPSFERGRVFREVGYCEEQLSKSLHPSLQSFIPILVLALGYLHDGYLRREQEAQLDHIPSYSEVHADMYGIFEDLKELRPNPSVQLVPRRKQLLPTNTSLTAS